MKGRYCVSGGQVCLKLHDLIRWIPDGVHYRRGKNSAWQCVIMVAFCILHPDVMRFKQDPSVGIGIFYLPIKSQTLNICRAVKLLSAVEQPILKCNKYTGIEYIQIISKHQSTNFVSPVLVFLCTKSLSKVGNSEIFWCTYEWGQFGTSAHSADMSFPQMMNLLGYGADESLLLTLLEEEKMALRVFHHLLVAESRMISFAEPVLYHPSRAR